jgi:hypothetical protein
MHDKYKMPLLDHLPSADIWLVPALLGRESIAKNRPKHAAFPSFFDTGLQPGFYTRVIDRNPPKATGFFSEILAN